MAGKRPRIVVVGGGFGGLYAAKELARFPVEVTIVDRRNYHLFQPLLYQVATAGLSPAEIASPIRQILEKHRNVEVLMGEVVDFDLAARRVILQDFSLPYDYLVVAAGASHSYFGRNDWEQVAPGLKTIEDALEIRRRVLLAFEIAERDAVHYGQHRPLNFVVVGGGPTGVELAGTLAEVAKRALADDFRKIDPTRTRIILVEAGPRILPAYPEDLSKSAVQQLNRLGVEVRLNTKVTEIEPGRISLGDFQMDTSVTLWAAGVQANALGKKLGVPTDRVGRVVVNADCTVPGHPEVFVIGDLAAFNDESGKPLPGVAPVAIQQGDYVANTIGNELKGRSRKSFRYRNKGNLATIGRAAAVADFGKFKLTGFPAWISWLFIHIWYLIGFRNRVIVFINWAWSYFTMERGARLITGDTSLPGVSVAGERSRAEQEPETIEVSPRRMA